MGRRLRILLVGIILIALILPVCFSTTPVYAAHTLILRPNAAGDETSLPVQYPNSTAHWDKVSESVADDYTTYVAMSTTINTYQRDLYNLEPHTTETGVINSVTIYFRIGDGSSNGTCYAKPSQKSGGTVTDGTEVAYSIGTNFVFSTYSQTYTTNPATGNAYTWAEIDSLQVGISLKSAVSYKFSECTQIYVEVSYISTPNIVAVSASNRSTTAATLNAQITDDGGDVGACQVSFGYGKVSQTAINFANYTTKTSFSGTYSTNGYAPLDVTGLDATTTYYYRVQVKNANSTVTSSNEISFTTLTSLALPTNVKATPLSTSISLTWTKGTGASGTLVRYSTTTFPTTTSDSDGSLAYSGTDSTYVYTSLTLGQTYFYSLWGTDGGSYSPTYAEIAMTTVSTGITASGLPTIATPTNFDVSAPDTSKLTKLEPFYSLINGFVDSWGMPQGNAWSGIVAFIIVIISLVIYVRSASISAALVVMVVCMILGYFIGVVSGWWILFGILGMLGSFALPKREV